MEVLSMKRILAFLVALLLIVPSAFADPLVITAGSIDLSGLSYNELVALKDRINLAIWESDEWQEVTVPQGVWEVGVDIPEGHWTIKTEQMMANVTICDTLNESGKDADIWNSKVYYSESLSPENGMGVYSSMSTAVAEMDFDLKDGMYVIVNYGKVIFTPYAGKPSLGFK